MVNCILGACRDAYLVLYYANDTVMCSGPYLCIVVHNCLATLGCECGYIIPYGTVMNIKCFNFRNFLTKYFFVLSCVLLHLFLFLPETSFGLWVLSLPASVCVHPSLCLSASFYTTWCVIIHHSFKLGSPNLDQMCKRPWLRYLLFCKAIGVELKRSNITPFELVCTIAHPPFKLGSLNLDQRCKTPWLRTLSFLGLIGFDLHGQILLESANVSNVWHVH